RMARIGLPQLYFTFPWVVSQNGPIWTVACIFGSHEAQLTAQNPRDVPVLSRATAETMKSRTRKRIAMTVPHGLQHMERAIHGITDYAKQHAHWSFSRVPETFGTSLEWLRFWHGDGAFAAIYTPEDARLAQGIGIPIVNLATHLPQMETPSITMDHIAVGELAAGH